MLSHSIQKCIRLMLEWVFSLSALIVFALWGLLISLLSLIIKPILSRHLSHLIARYSMHYLLKFYFAVLGLTGLFTVDGKALDQLRNEARIIIIANHPCLMDALFVMSRLPNAVSIMKSSVLNNPLLFGGAWLGGFIGTDSTAHFFQQCQETLEEGGQLLFFPEGTRSLCETVNPFKGGFALVAQKTGVPIQTVFIDANTAFLGKRWSIWNKPPFPLKYHITLGQRFQLDKGHNHKTVTAKLEAYFKEKLTHRSPCGNDAESQV